MMKKRFFNILLMAALMSFSSCSLFTLDNYAEPEETLKGSVVDANTGEPVLTDQGAEGIRVRLTETSWEGNVTPQDFFCRADGTFRNTRLFDADYNVRVDGPFIPIVRETQDGVVLADESVNTRIKGTTEVNFKVLPFLKVEMVGVPVASSGKIKAKVKVTRAVSREEFKEKIEPMGGYHDDFANVTDVQLFVSYSPSPGYRARDERWSSHINFGGSTFDQNLGKEIELVTNGSIPSGRKVFIRAAARINYDTPRGSGMRRWNYSEPVEVFVP